MASTNGGGSGSGRNGGAGRNNRRNTNNNNNGNEERERRDGRILGDTTPYDPSSGYPPPRIGDGGAHPGGGGEPGPNHPARRRMAAAAAASGTTAHVAAASAGIGGPTTPWSRSSVVAAASAGRAQWSRSRVRLPAVGSSGSNSNSNTPTRGRSGRAAPANGILRNGASVAELRARRRNLTDSPHPDALTSSDEEDEEGNSIGVEARTTLPLLSPMRMTFPGGGGAIAHPLVAQFERMRERGGAPTLPPIGVPSNPLNGESDDDGDSEGPPELEGGHPRAAAAAAGGADRIANAARAARIRREMIELEGLGPDNSDDDDDDDDDYSDSEGPPELDGGHPRAAASAGGGGRLTNIARGRLAQAGEAARIVNRRNTDSSIRQQTVDMVDEAMLEELDANTAELESARASNRAELEAVRANNRAELEEVRASNNAEIEAVRASNTAEMEAGNNFLARLRATQATGGSNRRGGNTNNNNNNRGGNSDGENTPGLRRIMNRLFLQTVGMRAGLLPDQLDNDNELDFFGLFNDAFDPQPPIDVRKPDQLVCPTCMSVHLPVGGSERISFPKEPVCVEVNDEGEAVAGEGNSAEGEGNNGAENGPTNVEDNDGDDEDSEDGEEDDDDSYHPSTHASDSESPHSSLPPLSSDLSSVDDGSLDSLPPLIPAPAPCGSTEENHDASLSSSGGVGRNHDASFNASNATVRPGAQDPSPRASAAQDPPPSRQPFPFAQDPQSQAAARDTLITPLITRASAAVRDARRPRGSELQEPFPPLEPFGVAQARHNEFVSRVNRNNADNPNFMTFTDAMNEAMNEFSGIGEMLRYGIGDDDDEEEDWEDVDDDDDDSMPSLETVGRLADGEGRANDAVANNDAASDSDGDAPSNFEDHDELVSEVEEASDEDSYDSMPPLEDCPAVSEDEAEDDNNSMPPLEDRPILSNANDDESVVDEEELLRLHPVNNNDDSSEDSDMPPLEDANDDGFPTANERQNAEDEEAQQRGSNVSSNEELANYPEFGGFGLWARMHAANMAMAGRRSAAAGDANNRGNNNASNGDAGESGEAPANANDNEGNDDGNDDQGSRGSNSVPPLVQRDDSSESSAGYDSSSSMPALIRRADMSQSSSSSSLSMPPLIRRDRSSSDDGSLPSLIRATASNRARLGESSMQRIRRLIVGAHGGPSGGGATTQASRNRSRNNDRPSNPLTHLRDYGALRVYASATCPICLDVHEPIVALQCGHAMCEDDFRRLGGYLASDKDKLKKLAAATASSENDDAASALPPEEEPMSVREARRIVGENQLAALQRIAARRSGETIPASVLVSSRTGTSRRRPSRRALRGTAWAFGITFQCSDPNCSQSGNVHRVLYSISSDGKKVEGCYPLRTKIIPDGHGGLWIHECRIIEGTTLWPMWHKNKRHEVEKFQVERYADVVADGTGGVWAISRPEREDEDSDNDDTSGLVSEIKRYQPGNDGNVVTHDVASVPVGSDLYYGGGRRGKVWAYTENTNEDFSFDPGDAEYLENGLWLLGSDSIRKFGDCSDGVGFSTGDVDPDGHGSLWYLEENEDMDALALKRCTHNGEHEEFWYEFPIGGTEIYGCDSAIGVFVFHQSPECQDGEGELTYISKAREGPTIWTRNPVAVCPNDTKFTSDGAGGLWALMVDTNGGCKFWKCDDRGMQPVYSWSLPFSTSELVAG